MIDLKFFQSVGIPVYTVDKEGIKEMMTEEDAWKIEQERQLARIKPDLEKVLEGLNTAKHYLHETSEYESDLLDNVCDSIQENINLIEGLISD